MSPISSSFLALSESTLFGSFICNRRLAIALEVAQPWSTLREFHQDQSYFDACPHLEAVPFLNELSWKAGDGPDFFVFSSSFRIYHIWFIYMRQKTCNRVGSCPTVKSAERISPRLELHFDAYPHLEGVPISQQIKLEGWGWARYLCLF